MNHITQETARELDDSLEYEIEKHSEFIHSLCNAAIEWYIAQAAKDIPQILEQLANEPPISGNHMARTRVLLAADWYKKDQKMNTSQERVYETAKSEQMPLTDEQIEDGRKAIFSTDNPYCPCDSKTMRKAVQWAERKHGIKEPKV